MIAALYVETDGIYAGRDGVELWDIQKDARLYDGPHAVVAHPPCQRWGRFWHGSTRKPHQYTMGDDGGCFAAALASVRRWGGVLEHPAYTHAWRAYDLLPPKSAGGWSACGDGVGVVCHVEQGHYGHMSRKPTWLYAVGCDLPVMVWGKSPQRLDPVALARHGYEKARRIGVVAMVGGKHKTAIRNATPPEFCDILIAMARTVRMT